ncbi:hypothetical protein AMELA_G00095860 [Ameiurus melas]|uniref:Uncharacterized protein n=1 Tax=Ameiurus melas TaxID=219545 RepID=A0A7J6AU84_AMEME|nr:hypothetical protein AMELA_G00095860 [Ameiurus melas]
MPPPAPSTPAPMPPPAPSTPAPPLEKESCTALHTPAEEVVLLPCTAEEAVLLSNPAERVVPLPCLAKYQVQATSSLKFRTSKSRLQSLMSQFNQHPSLPIHLRNLSQRFFWGGQEGPQSSSLRPTGRPQLWRSSLRPTGRSLWRKLFRSPAPPRTSLHSPAFQSCQGGTPTFNSICLPEETALLPGTARDILDGAQDPHWRGGSVTLWAYLHQTKQIGTFIKPNSLHIIGAHPPPAVTHLSSIQLGGLSGPVHVRYMT